MSTKRPDLGVVVVSYNTRDLLDVCLQSLAAEIERSGLTADVRVIDNASSDGSADMVATHHPWARLTALERNVGFAAANNVALEPWAAGDDAPSWVLALNPDTELRPGALATLIDGLAQSPGAGVAGPALIYPEGRFQHSAFRFPGLVQTVLDLFPIARLTDSRLNGRYARSAYAAGEPFVVDFPLGACMLVRAEGLREVGPLDEGYFMYCEEIDWCRRFRQAGRAAVCVPGAVVVHHAGASTRQFRSAMFSTLWRRRLRLFARHEPTLRRALLSATVRLGLRLRAVADRVAVVTGRLEPEERTARAAAYRAVFESAP